MIHHQQLPAAIRAATDVQAVCFQPRYRPQALWVAPQRIRRGGHRLRQQGMHRVIAGVQQVQAARRRHLAENEIATIGRGHQVFRRGEPADGLDTVNRFTGGVGRQGQDGKAKQSK